MEFGSSARALLDEISRRILAMLGFAGSQARLNRQISAGVQIGNAACIQETHSWRLY